jgi:hypothetical protein
MNAQAVAAIGEAIEKDRKRRAVSVRLGADDDALLRRVSQEAGVRPAELVRLLTVRALTAIADQEAA